MELDGSLRVPVTIGKLMAVVQSSWNKAFPLLTLNLLYSLWICSFTSMVLIFSPVYDLGWYGVCFVMAFHSGKKPSQRSTNARKVLWHSTLYLPGNLYRLYQQNNSAASVSGSSSGKLSRDVCMRKHHHCLSRA